MVTDVIRFSSRFLLTGKSRHHKLSDRNSRKGRKKIVSKTPLLFQEIIPEEEKKTLNVTPPSVRSFP